MGTFFSLSRSATSTALEMSEIALLLFGLLLVVGLIGEYAEAEHWKRHVRVFEMFVIIGVAGELLADGGIFLFSSHLQTIADLEIARLTREAGDAKTSAENASTAASRASSSAHDAGVEAGKAEDAAAHALGKSNEANTAASNALGLAHSATKYLNTVAERQADRRLDPRKFLGILKGKPKNRVLLLYSPNDSEAWTLAREIYWWLGAGPSKEDAGAGWTVFSPKPIPPNAGTLSLGELADAPPAMRFDGAYSESGLTFITKKLQFSPGTGVNLLNMALVVSISPRAGSSSFVEDPSLPDDLIVLVVGSKPTWLWGLEKPGKP